MPKIAFYFNKHQSVVATPAIVVGTTNEAVSPVSYSSLFETQHMFGTTP